MRNRNMTRPAGCKRQRHGGEHLHMRGTPSANEDIAAISWPMTLRADCEALCFSFRAGRR